jgi:hypothetical protein
MTYFVVGWIVFWALLLWLLDAPNRDRRSDV